MTSVRDLSGDGYDSLQANKRPVEFIILFEQHTINDLFVTLQLQYQSSNDCRFEVKLFENNEAEILSHCVMTKFTLFSLHWELIM